MSSHGFATCRVFEPGPSRQLAAALVVIHAGAAVALACAQIGWGWKPPLLLALALGARRQLALHASRSAAGAVVRLARRADGSWIATRRDGRASVGALHPDSFIHRHLLVLGIRDGWRPLFVPLAPDALAPDQHRRLRVWVRWQARDL